MIERIKLKFGSTPAGPPLDLSVTPVTVFVGPNYSGKSKVLSEIAAQCFSGQPVPSDVILEELYFRASDQERAKELMKSVTAELQPGEGLLPDHVMVGRRGQRQQTNKDVLIRVLMDPNAPHSRSTFANSYMRFRSLMLNGRNRIDLVNDQPGGDLQGPAQSTFQQLFRDDTLRQKLSRLVHEALGLYLVADPTALGTLRLRLSKISPPSPEVERGLTQASVEFHGAATHIQATSDGAKAFVGILAEILAGDP